MARWDRSQPAAIPEWFFEAVETPSESAVVEVEECDVVWRAWDAPANKRGAGNTPESDLSDERGVSRQRNANAPAARARGLLLIHGMNAHSRWWDFIAPALADDYRVVAMDLTGMGDSDYRYEYDSATYAKEIVAVCDAAGLGTDVIVVGHSFGGNMATKAANLHPDRFGALILADSGLRHPDEPRPDMPSMGGRAKAYPDKRTALARFRLQPPQPCANAYILEHIARHSLMPIDGGGWAWKFDADLPNVLKDAERQPEDYASLRLPVGLIYGAESKLFSERTRRHMQSLIPGEVPAVAIPDAQHHLFLDQPQAFIDALRKMCREMG
ncbi:MAG: alpha/beta hydrolase [Gammaproteobacteria bacterium]|nr:alpha/beta hydrolase [Gammaproteobacteria bacterium]